MFQCFEIIPADLPQATTDQIESPCGGLKRDFLHLIGLIYHPSDLLKDWIITVLRI